MEHAERLGLRSDHGKHSVHDDKGRERTRLEKRQEEKKVPCKPDVEL